MARRLWWFPPSFDAKRSKPLQALKVTAKDAAPSRQSTPIAATVDA
jgi:hypothetical protein